MRHPVNRWLFPCVAVTCSAGDACKNADIHCSTWGSCRLGCESHDHSCESTELYCGNDTCTILCSDVDQGGHVPTFGSGTCPNLCDDCTSSGRDC